MVARIKREVRRMNNLSQEDEDEILRILNTYTPTPIIKIAPFRCPVCKVEQEEVIQVDRSIWGREGWVKTLTSEWQYICGHQVDRLSLTQIQRGCTNDTEKEKELPTPTNL